MSSTAMQQVVIGPEFFRKIRMDYADWRWALVREFLQNCFDAPKCSEVKVEIVGNVNGKTVMTVSNNGAPMDRECLTTKLLTLGGSGKNFQGENTGGFGVAKSLLYYCHNKYTIWTGNLLVQGQGAQYTISEETETFPGTQSIIEIDGGNEGADLLEKIEKFARMAQWKGTLTVNGQVLETNLHKGARRKDIGWGVVYTNNSFTNTCIVRLNGQPMFSCYTRFKGCVLVELTGKACSTLTSNRDGLVRPFSSELNDLLTALAVDKKSALREQQAEYKRYQGQLQKNEAKRPVASDEDLAAMIDLMGIAERVGGAGSTCIATSPDLCGTAASTCGNEQAPPCGTGGIKLVVASTEDGDKSVSVGPQFILKNTTGKKLPAHYVPGEGFSKYSKDLVRVWTSLLLKLHQICERDGEFSVGFVFDGESEAECEQGPYGRVYYVNPCKLVDGRLEKRYEGAWQNRCELIATACHEFVHGAYGLGQHDEDYAGQLTEVTANAMYHFHDLVQLCRPTAVSTIVKPAAAQAIR